MIQLDSEMRVRGITQEALAELAGINRVTLNRFIHEKQTPGYGPGGAAERIASAMKEFGWSGSVRELFKPACPVTDRIASFRVRYGKFLRSSRLLAGYNRAADFCAAVDASTGVQVKKETLYRIERGLQSPTVEQLMAFDIVLSNGEEVD